MAMTELADGICIYISELLICVPCYGTSTVHKYFVLGQAFDSILTLGRSKVILNKKKRLKISILSSVHACSARLMFKFFFLRAYLAISI